VANLNRKTPFERRQLRDAHSREPIETRTLPSSFSTAGRVRNASMKTQLSNTCNVKSGRAHLLHSAKFLTEAQLLPHRIPSLAGENPLDIYRPNIRYVYLHRGEVLPLGTSSAVGLHRAGDGRFSTIGEARE
jgi:hypothetical protein